MRSARARRSRGSGLRMPTSPEMTTPSNSSPKRSRGRSGAVPHEFESSPVRIPARLRGADGARTSPRRAPCRPNSRSIRPVVARRSEHRGEAPLELRLGERARARASKSSSRASRVRRGTASRTCAGRGPRARRSLERGEDVRRQDAAQVDEQAATRRVSRHARSPRPLGELEHALAERLRGTGRRCVPGDRALVVALHEHDRLPQRERRVPADVGHRAPGALLVARDELGARSGSPAARVTARSVDHAARRVAALGPQSCTGSRRRRAGRRSSPSPSRRSRSAGRARRREHHVAEAVVAVHDRGRAGLRQCSPQPARRRVSTRRDLARARCAPRGPVKRRSWRSR